MIQFCWGLFCYKQRQKSWRSPGRISAWPERRSCKNYCYSKSQLYSVFLIVRFLPPLFLSALSELLHAHEATVHRLMNDINLIDNCQAHLPVQYASNIKFICQKCHWCCDHLSCTCKTSLLFAPLAVRVHTGCSAFPFYTPTKPLIQ